MHPDAQKWVEQFHMQAHPEGGYFAETYRSAGSYPALPGFDGERSYSTGIYFLLTGADISALHRIRSDEMWHFYAGTDCRIEAILPDGSAQCWTIGPRGPFQAVAPAGCWFGASLPDPQGYALVGCTVAPGFDYHDFELAEPGDLLRHFPQQRELIERLGRKA